jgi:hypothetical protein
MELTSSLHPPTEVHVVLEYHSPSGAPGSINSPRNGSPCSGCDSPLSSAPNSPDSPGRKRILETSSEDDEDEAHHHPHLQMPTLSLQMIPLTKQSSTLGRESRKSRLLRTRMMQQQARMMSSSSFLSNPQQQHEEEVPLDEKKSNEEEGELHPNTEWTGNRGNPVEECSLLPSRTNDDHGNPQRQPGWMDDSVEQQQQEEEEAEIPLISTLQNNKRMHPITTTTTLPQSQNEIEHELQRIVLPFDEVVTITNNDDDNRDLYHRNNDRPIPKEEASPDDERDELLRGNQTINDELPVLHHCASKRILPTFLSSADNKACNTNRDATAPTLVPRQTSITTESNFQEWMEKDVAGPEDEQQLHENNHSNIVPNQGKQPLNQNDGDDCYDEICVFQPNAHVGTSREEDIEVSLVDAAAAPSYDEARTPSLDQGPQRVEISFQERPLKTTWTATFDDVQDDDYDLHAVPTDEQISNYRQARQKDQQSLFHSFSFPPAVNPSHKLQSSLQLENSTILHVSSYHGEEEEEEEMPLDELILDHWNRRSFIKNENDGDETCPLLNVTGKEPVAKMLDLTETSVSGEGTATMEDKDEKKIAALKEEGVRKLPVESQTMLMDRDGNTPSLSVEQNCLPHALEQHRPLLEEGFSSSDGTPLSNGEGVARFCRPTQYQHRRDRLYNENSLPEYWKKQSLKSRKLLQRSMHKSKRMATSMMKSRDRLQSTERVLSGSVLSESVDHYHVKSIGVKTIATVCNGVGNLFHGETLSELSKPSKRRKEVYQKLSPENSPNHRWRQLSKSSSLSSPTILESKTDSEISSESLERRFPVPQLSLNVDVKSDDNEEVTPLYFAEALERSIEAEDDQQDTAPHQWKSSSKHLEAGCSSTESSFSFDAQHKLSQTNKYATWLELVKSEVSKVKIDQVESSYAPRINPGSRSMCINERHSESTKHGGSDSRIFSRGSLVNDLRRHNSNYNKQSVSLTKEELGKTVISSISEDGSEETCLLPGTPRHKKRTEQTDLRSCRTEKTAALTPLSDPPTLRRIGDGPQVEWSIFNPILLRERFASRSDCLPSLEAPEESVTDERTILARSLMADFLSSNLNFSDSNNPSFDADISGSKIDRKITLSSTAPSSSNLQSATWKSKSNPSFDASLVQDKCVGTDKPDFRSTEHTSSSVVGSTGSTVVDRNPSLEVSQRSDFSGPISESSLQKIQYATHTSFDDVEKSFSGCGLPDFQASRIQDASNPSFDAFSESLHAKGVTDSRKSRDLSCNDLTTEDLLNSLDDMVKDLDNLTSDNHLDRAPPSSSIAHDLLSSFGYKNQKFGAVDTHKYSNGESYALSLNDVPFLITSINNDIGIPRGDIVLSLLNNESTSSSVDEAIWRLRTMRRQCDTRWLEYIARRATQGPITRKQRSLRVDVDEVRVLGAGVREIEKAAIEHIRHDDFDDALTLYEEILLAYKKSAEESHSELLLQKYKEYIGVAHHNLGIVNLLLGEHQSAYFHFENATAERAKCFGVGHPDHLVSRSMLAYLCEPSIFLPLPCLRLRW